MPRFSTASWLLAASDVKRYEITYANKVLDVLTQDGGRQVERSVRDIAREAGISASAAQIGLGVLRRTARIKTLRRGSAGRPSVLEVVDVARLGGDKAELVTLSQALAGAGAPAQAFAEEYEALLRKPGRSGDLDELRRRVEALEARVAALERARSTPLNLSAEARLPASGQATPDVGGHG
jgi:hypothetical protein